MLHILLLILKVIGIIFAVILGILVLLACVVLYVPVRYDLRASCDGTLAGIRAGARVTWLLHLVGLYVCYEEKELTWRIRIAWKNIRSGQEEKNTIRAEVETYGEEVEELREDAEEAAEEEYSGEVLEGEEERSGEVLEEVEERTAEVVEGEEERSGDVLEEDRKRIAEAVEVEEGNSGEAVEEVEERTAEDCEDREEDSEGSEEDRRRELGEASVNGEILEEQRSVWQKIADFCHGIWQKITGLYRKIAGIPAKLRDAVSNIRDKAEALKGKKDKILDFLTDEVHKKAFVKVKDELLRLLRKLKPKKISARVRYGFEDPSLTGRILAGISVAYPFLGDDVEVYPDFERRVLDGEVKIAGRIRASYFVWLLWKLVWCKEVRMTYRHVRQFKL